MMRPVTCRPFSTPASSAAAVPSASPCSTGMSSASLSAASTAKQAGAAMSARCTPANTDEILVTTSAMAAGSSRSTGMGKASTLASSRMNSDSPSRTGSEASGPRSPCPTSADPSLTTITLLPLMVRSHARSGSSWIAMHTRATPGV